MPQVSWFSTRTSATASSTCWPLALAGTAAQAAAAQDSVDFTLPKSATEKSDAGTTQAAQQTDDSGFPWTLVVVVVVVLVLAGAGLAVARRGRNA